MNKYYIVFLLFGYIGILSLCKPKTNQTNQTNLKQKELIIKVDVECKDSMGVNYLVPFFHPLTDTIKPQLKLHKGKWFVLLGKDTLNFYLQPKSARIIGYEYKENRTNE